MNFKMNGSALRKSVGVALMMVVPAFAGSQHKASAPAPHAAPAAHASAPSHASTPSHANTATHANTASHTTTTSHAATTSHTTTPNRSATTTHTNTGATSHTTTPSHATTANHTTTANHAATTSHTTTTSHTATTSHSTTAGHGATTTHTTTTSRTTTTSHTPPGRNVSLKGGGSASVRPNGQIRSINRNGTQINRGLHGGRTVVTNRNGARIVSNGRRGGYVQRAYVTRGGGRIIRARITTTAVTEAAFMWATAMVVTTTTATITRTGTIPDFTDGPITRGRRRWPGAGAGADHHGMATTERIGTHTRCILRQRSGLRTI
jgi:hypothetical protein